MVADLSVGAVIAGYSVESVCGRGGMSVVYRADDPRLHRKVALKVIAAHLADDAGFRARFLRETMLAASLDHPHVVPVYDAGDDDGTLFMAMRYVDGADLRTRLHIGGPLPLATANSVVSALAGALAAAHARGLVHRDVKPGNVLLARGQGEDGSDHVYLADFGLARSSVAVTATSNTGQLVGTIAYMAPEQIRGEPATPATDVYSLGCVLFECLTGTPIFVRDLDVAVLWAHLHDTPPSLAAAGVEVPAALDDVIARSLCKDPRDRYPTAEEFNAAFRVAAAPEVAIAVAASMTPRGALPAPRPRPEDSEAGGAALKTLELGTVEPPQSDGPMEPATTRRSPAWRRRTLIPVLALVAAAIATVVVVEERPVPRRGGNVTIPADSVVTIDPATLAVTRPITVGRGPSYLAAGADGSVWAANAGSDTITVVDRAGAVLTGGGTGHLTGIAVAGESVWVSAGFDGNVVRIDPRTVKVVNAIHVDAGLNGLAVDDAGGVWVADPIAGKIVHVDNTTQTVDDEILVGHDPRAVAFAGGSLWVTDGVDKKVLRVDPNDHSNRVKISLQFVPQAVAVGAGAAWVTHQGDDSVSRVNLVTNRADQVIAVGNGPSAIAIGAGAVWVADSDGTSVSRIDPETYAVRNIELGRHPYGIAFVGGRIVVSISGE